MKDAKTDRTIARQPRTLVPFRRNFRAPRTNRRRYRMTPDCTWLTVPLPDTPGAAPSARNFLVNAVLSATCRMLAFHVTPKSANALIIWPADDCILLACHLLDVVQTETGARPDDNLELLITPNLPRRSTTRDFAEAFGATAQWGWWPGLNLVRPAPPLPTDPAETHED